MLNLQDSFLNHARTQKIPVNIYLMNGYQLKGTIAGFDPFIVLLETSGKQTIVYKHAISTIMPLKPVQFFRSHGDMEGEEIIEVGQEEHTENAEETPVK